MKEKKKKERAKEDLWKSVKSVGQNNIQREE